MTTKQLTPQDMLAHALNNFNWRDGNRTNVCVYSRATIEKFEEVFARKRRYGFEIVAVEDVPLPQVRAAMEWYAQHTDWRAFSRQHYDSAMRWLNDSV